ncbi:MAG: hypothetical protein KGS72_04120 [Cyanobacteria bacterium REEB67]|nr:hypothetical protein [Cyanobacteria bacterium REEB67]
MLEAQFQAAEASWLRLSRAYQVYQGTNGGALPRRDLVAALAAWKGEVIVLAQALKTAAREADVRQLAQVPASVPAQARG